MVLCSLPEFAVRCIRAALVPTASLYFLAAATGWGVALVGAASAQETELSEILVDEWGVPHVYAEDFESLGWGFGWTQMEAHGDAILRLYGMARGRGAEYWGGDFFASDLLLHALDIPDLAQAALDEQNEELRAYLEAFAAGMNAYAEVHPDALADEAAAVLPVEPEDPLRHIARVLFTFAAMAGERDAVVGFDGMPAGTAPGSNTWAIGPGRSESGNAMLLQNPHLPWTVPMMRLFEAHLVAPGVNLYGTAPIGMPAIAFGFNEHLGWSHTVNTVDVVDTYRLILREEGYLFDGETRPFEREEEVILVRQLDGTLTEEVVMLLRSVHGPVVSISEDTAIALRTPMLERHGVLEQFWDMGRAGSLEEFLEALRQLQLPVFTVSYADDAGHIYYLFNGQVPDRPFGDFEFWRQPVPGDTSATLWTGIHKFDDLPQVLDPPGGFVQNANSPPWGAAVPSELRAEAFPPYMAPEYLLLREQRALELLLGDESIGFEEFLNLRYDNRVLLADRLLDDLLPLALESDAADVREAAAVLQAWDRQLDAGSRGAVLFWVWSQEFCRRPQEPRSPCAFATPWMQGEPLSTPDGLASPADALEILSWAAAVTGERFGAIDVPWGEVMRLSEKLPGNGGQGDPLGVFHVLEYMEIDGLGLRPVFGDSWVATIEFTSEGPRARGLLTYGNESIGGFPYSSAQLELLAAKEMRPLWTTRDEVEAHTLRRMSIPEGR